MIEMPGRWLSDASAPTDMLNPSKRTTMSKSPGRFTPADPKYVAYAQHQDESEDRWISLDRLTPADVHVGREHVHVLSYSLRKETDE